MIKKLLYTIFALTFSFLGISQTQPENPGFENWEDVSLDEDEPVDWSSIKTSDGGWLINTFAPYVWEQSTDAHTGQYSIRLTNIYVSLADKVAAGTITNGRVHAESNGTGWVYTIPTESGWNTPLTQKPDSIAVWAKFTQAGADVAQVKAVVHDGTTAKIADEDSVNYIAVAKINISESVSSWTRFSAPFEYINDNDPAYILMVLSAADDLATEGTEAFYDDVEFIYNPLSLDLTAFLEGPYVGSGQMNANLNPGNLPLSQPFNTAPWNYTGTESVAAIPNADVVDWVLIELRDAANAAAATSATTIARQAGFLLRDGSIVGLDGIGRLNFDNTISENMFVVVKHRNHLGIMSADPLVKADGFYTYNFTDASAKTYGGENGIKQLSVFGPSVWGMIGGDGDASGTVDSVDKTSFWSILTGKAGYLSGDYDMDGQIDNTDKNDVWLINIDETTQVPN